MTGGERPSERCMRRELSDDWWVTRQIFSPRRESDFSRRNVCRECAPPSVGPVLANSSFDFSVAYSAAVDVEE